MNDEQTEDQPESVAQATWVERDLPIARMVARPIRHFIHVETAGGLVLLAAAVAALVVANTGLADPVETFWQRELTLIEIGDFHLTEDLLHWVNDGLMAIFFFVVGLEIKRELVTGELKDPTRAALPAIAALGGIVVPAALYTAFNAGGPGADGWGIPMATDIAFVVGVLAILGSRVPSGLRIFLLTLAIVDDIVAILVIAVFYTAELSIGWLSLAGAGLVLIVAMRLGRVWYVPAYVAVGVAIWVATLESGVHATIAGVALGLLAPAVAFRPNPTQVNIDPQSSLAELRSTIFDARESLPVAERLEYVVHPWSAFIILPLFAFANARIELSADVIGDAATSRIALGVVVGLVVGKPLGIVAATWIVTRFRLGTLPPGVTMRHVIGGGALGRDWIHRRPVHHRARLHRPRHHRSGKDRGHRRLSRRCHHRDRHPPNERIRSGPRTRPGTAMSELIRRRRTQRRSSTPSPP